jgi:hypothetical protein
VIAEKRECLEHPEYYVAFSVIPNYFDGFEMNMDESFSIDVSQKWGAMTHWRKLS